MESKYGSMDKDFDTQGASRDDKLYVLFNTYVDSFNRRTGGKVLARQVVIGQRDSNYKHAVAVFDNLLDRGQVPMEKLQAAAASGGVDIGGDCNLREILDKVKMQTLVRAVRRRGQGNAKDYYVHRKLLPHLVARFDPATGQQLLDNSKGHSRPRGPPPYVSREEFNKMVERVTSLEAQLTALALRQSTPMQCDGRTGYSRATNYLQNTAEGKMFMGFCEAHKGREDETYICSLGHRPAMRKVINHASRQLYELTHGAAGAKAWLSRHFDDIFGDPKGVARELLSRNQNITNSKTFGDFVRKLITSREAPCGRKYKSGRAHQPESSCYTIGSLKKFIQMINEEGARARDLFD